MSNNTMSSTLKLSEYFAKLPSCNQDGTNWVYFRDRFIFAATAAGLNEHLEKNGAMAEEPKQPPIADPKVPTADETKANEEYLRNRKIWRSEQAVLKQAIASVITDTLFLKVKSEKTALLMWNKVKDEFEKKSNPFRKRGKRSFGDPRI